MALSSPGIRKLCDISPPIIGQPEPAPVCLDDFYRSTFPVISKCGLPSQGIPACKEVSFSVKGILQLLFPVYRYACRLVMGFVGYGKPCAQGIDCSGQVPPVVIGQAGGIA